MGYTSDMTIITLDGNIGVGKSTLLTQIGERMPEVEIVLEPVGNALSSVVCAVYLAFCSASLLEVRGSRLSGTSFLMASVKARPR